MTAQISDTESDEQFLVELPDVQVVGDGVATTSVTICVQQSSSAGFSWCYSHRKG